MAAVKALFVITALIIIALHAGTAFFKKKLVEALGYVNLSLHIALIIELMALEVSFEFAALCFMLTLLVYLFFSFISYKIRIRRQEKRDV